MKRPVLFLAGLALAGLLALDRLPSAKAQAAPAADAPAADAPAAAAKKDTSPGAVIAAAREAPAVRPAKLAPEGPVVDGVRRDAVRVVNEGQEIDEGDLVVDARGRVTVAVVRRRGDGEEIIVLRTRTPEGKFGPIEVVSSPAKRGQRAWHPRLATGPKGAVWLTWCGHRPITTARLSSSTLWSCLAWTRS